MKIFREDNKMTLLQNFIKVKIGKKIRFKRYDKRKKKIKKLKKTTESINKKKKKINDTSSFWPVTSHQI